MRKSLSPLFRILLPSRCLLCNAQANDTGFCPACARSLPWLAPGCPTCALPGPGLRCGQCLRSNPAFDHTLGGLSYQWPIRRLIHAFKFNGDLAAGRALTTAVLHRKPLLENTPLVPIPLHVSRIRERGFNQAERIARTIARSGSAPLLTNLLFRSTTSPDQKNLDRESRQRNLATAFTTHGRSPSRVIVVDDVMTTGATADAAARALKSAGAETVLVWCLARTI